MLDIPMKNFNFTIRKKKDHNMRYSALCTGCGTILHFDMDTSISITIDDKNEAINRFKCRASNNIRSIYFTCSECIKRVKAQPDSIYRPVLVIPKDLALATKVIVDSGIRVVNMGTSIIISSQSINLSDGKPEFYTIVPISGCLEIEGKDESETIYGMIKSIIDREYSEIFNCDIVRIMNTEEIEQFENGNGDAEDPNIPDEEQLYYISIYNTKTPAMGLKVENESDIDYKLIEDRNNKFIKLISVFAEALANMKNNKSKAN